MTEKDLKVGQKFKGKAGFRGERVEIVSIDKSSTLAEVEFKATIGGSYFIKEDNGNIRFPYFSFLDNYELIND